MRAVGELIAEVREALRAMVEPGISTMDLNNAADKMIRDAGAIPTFIGYHGFPYAICASVNDEIVHGFSKNDAVERRRHCFARYGGDVSRFCRRYGDDRSGRRDQRRTETADPRHGRMSRSRNRGVLVSITGLATSAGRFSSTPRNSATASFAIIPATASAERCTNRRRSRITAGRNKREDSGRILFCDRADAQSRNARNKDSER